MIELIYTSVTPEPLPLPAVTDILTTSKRNNGLSNITGHLFYDGHRFLQILEGADEAVYHLYDLIVSDPRHESVELLYEQEIETRSFPDWQMAYKPLVAHSLHNPMRQIETINDNHRYDIEEKTAPNFGAALFKVFRDSTVTP